MPVFIGCKHLLNKLVCNCITKEEEEEEIRCPLLQENQ